MNVRLDNIYTNHHHHILIHVGMAILKAKEDAATFKQKKSWWIFVEKMSIIDLVGSY